MPNPHDGAQDIGSRSEVASLTGVAAVGLVGTVNARVKSSLSRIHLNGARFFARQASELEPVPDADEPRDSHRTYVIGAVLASVASLEASVNELFHEISSGEKASDAFDDRSHKLIARWWADTERRRILEKYQRALIFAGLEPFEQGRNPFQDVASLIALRNALVHYTPEWNDEADGEHPSLELRLKGRFRTNPMPPGLSLWFPHQCLSADCAHWATRIVTEFMTDFCTRLGIDNRF